MIKHIPSRTLTMPNHQSTTTKKKQKTVLGQTSETNKHLTNPTSQHKPENRFLNESTLKAYTIFVQIWIEELHSASNFIRVPAL